MARHTNRRARCAAPRPAPGRVLGSVKERSYAFSVERCLANSAEIAFSEGARRELFPPLTRRRTRASPA